jgi:HlyD family secretion protein
MKSTSGPIWIAALALAVGSACKEPGPVTYQGYVEGEFVHVAPGAGGRLEKLFVKRGQTVEANAPLFQLEAAADTAAVHQADESAAAARAQLADLQTGKRGPELEVIRAQRDQAVLAEKQSAADLARDQAQFDAGGIPRAQVDATRTRHDVDVARVRELNGQLVVADQAARPEQIQAQNSQIAAADAVREQARTKLNEKRLVARQPGLIVDTLFTEGEWVPPGAPVVRMLPQDNIKLRFFVPEPALSQFKLGTKIALQCDGCPAALTAEVTYVSTQPEFTPPIIYSNDTRAKLVFMLEARPAAGAVASLRPGQPVTIRP